MTKSDTFAELGSSHPISLISTFGGIGHLPFAPGTWGAFAALPISWPILFYGGTVTLLTIAFILFLLGCFVTHLYEARTKNKDPSCVVLDEFVGQMIVLSIAPLNIGSFLLAFVLFRIADILKPWPVSWADQKIKGGIGIMLDDIIAAAYAAATLYCLTYLLQF